MKILVIGDIHGRSIWEKIYFKENPDKVIFLGDYVDSRENISPEEQIFNLKQILSFKEAYSENVILLRGNHDLSELGYSWAECSQFDIKVFKHMVHLKEVFLNLTQWVYIDEHLKTIFSHAGVSTEWMRINNIKSIFHINNLEPSEIFAFTPNKMSDYYGISPTQPPIWIRPQTLIEYMPEGWNQVVGHTPVKETIFSININNINLWVCDALELQQYLIIEDDEFIPKKLISHESTNL